ncbi:ROK family protein [Dactylosporangium sp. NBC_01737]|uniref:ROK family protein n=1 Tax=Dactylosporangium sp. NBC_01737 TaxID=2975959 RepID=UPI002E124074|nr:ROK family protein [Dactylosporangium sp. NBC_01737]
MTAVLAVDIGGTTFAAAVVRADRSIVDRAEVPVGADPTATLAALVGRFDLTGVRGVGVGSAGPVHLDLGAVSPVNIPAWRRFPITAVLADLTGGRPVALAGDAQCMALGEHWHGHAPSLLGVVVSTGVGGGLVLDGEPYLGRTGNAGHIGHIAVGAPPGRVRVRGERRQRPRHGPVGARARLDRRHRRAGPRRRRRPR